MYSASVVWKRLDRQEERLHFFLQNPIDGFLDGLALSLKVELILGLFAMEAKRLLRALFEVPAHDELKRRQFHGAKLFDEGVELRSDFRRPQKI